MTSITEISLLLTSVKGIIAHQEEIQRLRGETFNIFSVLKMERRENATHSALLAEFLNPSGSHLKNRVFLDLFLKTIGLPEHINSQTSWVKTEFSVGEVDLKKKTGGRLDIIICDDTGRTISIENKIYAGDKECQVERYYNYNKVNNKVIYLTLYGDEPTKESCGNLQSGEDYLLLSYKDGIAKWLQECLKEASDLPMLRETIKQYLMLISKMTSTPDNEHEKQLLKMLIDNYEVAAFVKNNTVKARQIIADQVRTEVCLRVKNILSSKFEVAIGDPIYKTYAQIWIWHNSFPNADLYFGIESFNGTGNRGGNLFVGIFNSSAKENSFTRDYGNQPRHWFDEQAIEFEGISINFGSDDLIIQIQKTIDFKERLTAIIVNQVVDFVQKHESKVLTYLKKPKSTGEAV